MKKKKLLFVVTEDWYFCSHRLSLAQAALNSGYEVFVATRITDEKYVPIIKAAGIGLLPLMKMTRGGKNPFIELQVIHELMKIFKSLQPDIIHHVAIKGVLYGSIAAKLTKMKATVNALAGLGHIFVSKQFLARLFRLIIISIFKFSFNGINVKFIFQNPDDLNLFIALKLAKSEDCYLIRGSGVNVKQFIPKNNRRKTTTFILASRMLWYKGVGELVEATRILKNKGLPLHVLLAGEPDLQNPKTISKEQLTSWHEEGVVEWIGFSSNMAALFSECDVAVLPSYYGEGVPKVLIEAAAMELPIITTEMPGCVEIARHEENGLLVPPKDVNALANAMERLIKDKSLREQLGSQGRKIVIEEFEESIVHEATLSIYRNI
jgi:glycosyltransferase involved in cell wall biosynthesis